MQPAKWTSCLISAAPRQSPATVARRFRPLDSEREYSSCPPRPVLRLQTKCRACAGLDGSFVHPISSAFVYTHCIAKIDEVRELPKNRGRSLGPLEEWLPHPHRKINLKSVENRCVELWGFVPHSIMSRKNGPIPGARTHWIGPFRFQNLVEIVFSQAKVTISITSLESVNYSDKNCYIHFSVSCGLHHQVHKNSIPRLAVHARTIPE